MDYCHIVWSSERERSTACHLYTVTPQYLRVSQSHAGHAAHHAKLTAQNIDTDTWINVYLDLLYSCLLYHKHIPTFQVPSLSNGSESIASESTGNSRCWQPRCRLTPLFREPHGSWPIYRVPGRRKLLD